MGGKVAKFKGLKGSDVRVDVFIPFCSQPATLSITTPTKNTALRRAVDGPNTESVHLLGKIHCDIDRG